MTAIKKVLSSCLNASFLQDVANTIVISNINFKYLETELPGLVASQEPDTLSAVFKMKQSDYKTPENQNSIKIK